MDADINMNGKLDMAEVSYVMQNVAEVRTAKVQASAGLLFGSGLFGLVALRKKLKKGRR